MLFHRVRLRTCPWWLLLLGHAGVCLAQVPDGVEPPDPAQNEAAPDRQTRLLEARRLKAGQLQPYRQKPLERLFFQLDQEGNATLEDTNIKGFYPRLAWIARGSGPALGVRYWRPEVFRGLDLMGSAFHSWNRYQHYDLQFGMIPNWGKGIPPSSLDDEAVEDQGEIDRSRVSRFRFYGSARYRYQPEVAYFGTGPDSRKEDRTDFLLKDFLARATVGYQFNPRIAWVVRTGLLRHALGPGRGSSTASLQEIFTADNTPGLDAPPSYVTFSSGLVVDSRDNPGVPRSGWFGALTWEKFHQLGGWNRYNFSQWGLDARTYLPLGSDDRVLALRWLSLYADATDGNAVPFFLQPSLGGSQGMRGFRSFRFRGDKLMQFQAEYRWEASRRLELAIFGDSGMVANKGERLSLHKLKSDVGIGVRFRSSRGILFRVDQAWSNEGPRTAVRFGGSF